MAGVFVLYHNREMLESILFLGLMSAPIEERPPVEYSECKIAFNDLETCERCGDAVLDHKREMCDEKPSHGARFLCKKYEQIEWEKYYPSCAKLPPLPPVTETKIILPENKK